MSSGDKLKVLFEIGEASGSRTWPDYLKYGFDEHDVPALLALVADESLNNADTESKEVWVPLHAWCTLGQIGSDEAIMPLIALFEQFVEDDWAVSEIPYVMGRIGETAIGALADYFNQPQHQEFARVIAMESLAKMVEYHPEVRGQIIQCYRTYMNSPDETAFALNGLLMAWILDLDAKELINEIRQMFQKGCVDISCAGDLEDVEIGLGLRAERSTPRPHYGMLSSADLSSELPKPNTDEPLEVIDHFLMHYGHDDSILDASELDGFFAALACAPETIMPSRWMPAIWGGESYSPEWETKEEFETFSRAIFAMYNQVMQCLNVDDFQALFHEREVEGKIYTIVDEWCQGFLRGIRLWGPLAAKDAAIVEELIEPLRLFATEDGFEKCRSMTADEEEARRQLIEPNVCSLYRHFFQLRKQGSEPYVRSQRKVGRNDPCICGSGKKFKKCCLH